jgi:hypothetical protein
MCAYARGLSAAMRGGSLAARTTSFDMLSPNIELHAIGVTSHACEFH